MSVCITPSDDLAPETKIRCTRCEWRGTVGEGKVIPNSIIWCPKCGGPCAEGHPPEKKKPPQ